MANTDDLDFLGMGHFDLAPLSGDRNTDEARRTMHDLCEFVRAQTQNVEADANKLFLLESDEQFGESGRVFNCLLLHFTLPGLEVYLKGTRCEHRAASQMEGIRKCFEHHRNTAQKIYFFIHKNFVCLLRKE